MSTQPVTPQPTARSEAAFADALRAIPGGVNSPVRAFGSVGGVPRFMVRGEGAHIIDEDGNRYIDLVQSWGPLPLGHAHPKIVEAAQAAAANGSTFGAPTRAEVTLAEKIIEAVPSVEQVRLVNSGTEASMTAVRLARGFTGRNKILKFVGHYHGHVDSLLVAAGSGVATLGIPGTPGVTPGTVADTILAPWNDIAALDAVIAAHGDDLAAILCEPIPANMNLVPAVEGFLAVLRDRATKCGALLVFDEVISGFRVSLGGAQASYAVTPDLTVMGKVIGGGYPLAAFGGRRDVMQHLAPVGPVYQAGTLSGNPVAVAAGTAQLDLLTPAVYSQLGHVAKRLVDGFAKALTEAGHDVIVRRVLTLSGIAFAKEPASDFAEMQQADHETYSRFFHAMLERGVYMAPSGYEVIFAATVHTDAVIDEVIEKAHDAALAIA